MVCTSAYFGALLAQTHSLIWIVIMWYPFVSTWFSYSESIYDWNQLTWWSWFVQTLFYTNMYVKTSIILRHPRRFIKGKWKSIIRSGSVCNCNCCFKFDFLFLGVALGISWFVFFMFGYVLYHNPTVVHIAAQNSTSQSVTQLGNILVHYYTVSAIFIWTVFNHKYVEKTMIKTLDSDCGKRYKCLLLTGFSFLWVLVLIGYLSYWRFNLQDVSKNYWIDDVDTNTSIVFGVAFMVIIALINFMYVFSI